MDEVKILTVPLNELYWESTIPTSYRLAKKASGELVLQGLFQWSNNMNVGGQVWKDIPTVELGE